MIPANQENRDIPLKIVGSTVFGRYPKISVEETYNMLISDGFLVPYAGFAAVLQLVAGGFGRGAHASTAANIIIAVVSNKVFLIAPGLTQQVVGTLATSIGDVFISENNNGDIAITDYSNIYFYNYLLNTFTTKSASSGSLPATLVHPGYITFQNGRFIVANTGTTEWQLSDFNSQNFPGTAAFVGELQTKPDTVQGAIRFPGRGNLLLVYGFTVAESWTDQALALFPYVKSTTFNIDYGLLNAATLDGNEDIAVWLSQNEKSGPAVTFTTGGEIERISTDGIDFKLSNLTNPTDCYGFLFRQDGHLIYQFAFPSDNLSYAYDFNTKKFFTVTDENLNYHPAKKVVFFNGVYYFVSAKDGNFYEFDTSITNYTYTAPNITPVVIKEIPRIRITPPLRLPTQQSYICKNMGFTIENGQPNTIVNKLVPQPIPLSVLMTSDGFVIETENGDVIQTTPFMGYQNFPISSAGVDLSMSNDGGETFGNSWRLNMNHTGKRKSLFIYRQLGRVNDRSFQLRFWGFDRFLCTDGVMEMYQ